MLYLPRKTLLPLRGGLGPNTLQGMGRARLNQGPWPRLTAAGGGVFRPLSVSFDGANDYMTSGAGLTGAADSKLLTVVAWVNFQGGDGVIQTIIDGENTNFILHKQADNTILLRTYTPGPVAPFYDIVSSVTLTASSGWTCIMASFDAAGPTAQLYFGDTNVLGSSTLADNLRDFTLNNWAIGGRTNNNDWLNGRLAEVWFAPGQRLDFSQQAKRRKFISATGKPQNLGSDGSAPTGTAPLVYQSVRQGEDASAFVTNRAGGGGFTLTGSITLADGP